MADLTDFLLQRIAEDETVARSATQGRWASNPKGAFSLGPAYGAAEGGPYFGVWLEVDDDAPDVDVATMVELSDNAEHIARHDPARVLAECEAKRRIALAAEANVCDTAPAARSRRDLGHAILCALAAVYSDHPDHRPEWTA